MSTFFDIMAGLHYGEHASLSVHSFVLFKTLFLKKKHIIYLFVYKINRSNSLTLLVMIA